MESPAHGKLTHSHDEGYNEGSIARLADRLVLRIVTSRRALVRVVSYMLAEQRKDRRYSAMSTMSTLSTLSTISNVSTVSTVSSLSSRSATSSESAGSAPAFAQTGVGARTEAASPLPLRSLPPSPAPHGAATAAAQGSFATLNQILSASLNKRKRPETHYDGIPISVILAHAQDPSTPSSPAAPASSSSSSPSGSYMKEKRKISSTRRVGLARMMAGLDVGERAEGHGGQEMRAEWDEDHTMGESVHSSSEEEEEEDDDDDDLVIIV